MRKLAIASLAVVILSGCGRRPSTPERPEDVASTHPGPCTVTWATGGGYQGIFTCDDYSIADDGTLTATVATVEVRFNRRDGLRPGRTVVVSPPFAVTSDEIQPRAGRPR